MCVFSPTFSDQRCPFSLLNRISKAHGVLQNTASPLEPHFPRWATATAIAAATLGCSAVAFSESPEIKIKPPDVWDRWDQVKSFLTSWKKSTGTAVPLPVDKLACHRIAGSSSSSGGSSGSSTGMVAHHLSYHTLSDN